jgi:hypothetical protein
MPQWVEPSEQVSANRKNSLISNPRSQVKQDLRQKIQLALQSAKDLPPQQCLREIRNRLLAIQAYCRTINKTFIVVEERITCNQYGLGGQQYNGAILFRGPSEDASVAICVTDNGSLLHRNSSPWKIYRNTGDIGGNIPAES